MTLDHSRDKGKNSLQFFLEYLGRSIRFFVVRCKVAGRISLLPPCDVRKISAKVVLQHLEETNHLLSCHPRSFLSEHILTFVRGYPVSCLVQSKSVQAMQEIKTIST